MHTIYYIYPMMFDWNDEKNQKLKSERDISFEDIVFHIKRDGLLDIIENPNQKRYEGQKIFIVNVEGYIYLVPFLEDNELIFLKTIIPSRKMTKLYLNVKGDNK
ncbi:MAG: BrnT family toxin [Candidatus Delongbacteria bacterium]|nr:BrnT family toxin [Candidatus Delongbacteria bacterium]